MVGDIYYNNNIVISLENDQASQTKGGGDIWRVSTSAATHGRPSAHSATASYL